MPNDIFEKSKFVIAFPFILLEHGEDMYREWKSIILYTEYSSRHYSVAASQDKAIFFNAFASFHVSIMSNQLHARFNFNSK